MILAIIKSEEQTSKNEMLLEHWINKTYNLMAKYEDPTDIEKIHINQSYKCALYYDSKSEFKNCGEIHSLENMMSKYYNRLTNKVECKENG